MWECPDFFPLDGKWVLILSPIEMERQQEKYWNLNSTVAFIGDMNWETGRFHVDPMMNWMVVWISMLLKLVKDQMANDTWLPGCKCGTGLSPVMI